MLLINIKSLFYDAVPERLRGWTANPLLYQRESSNLSGIESKYRSEVFEEKRTKDPTGIEYYSFLESFICLLYFNTIWRKKENDPTGIEYYSFLVFTTHFLTPPFHLSFIFQDYLMKKGEWSYWDRIQPFVFYISRLFDEKKTKDPPGIESNHLSFIFQQYLMKKRQKIRLG